MSNRFNLIKTVLFLTFCIPVAHSQVTYEVLDQNNLSATFSNTGTQLINYTSGTAQYQIPKNGGQAQFQGMQFWYAGKDANGQIHGAFGGDVANGTDIFNGPGNSGTGSNGAFIWSISQEEIDQYHVYWLCVNDPVSNPGCEWVQAPSNNVMATVLSWPHCFPFNDYNQDGMYTPENGDTPIIKGCRAVYMVQNDHQGAHTYSGAPALGITMCYLFYQFSQQSYLDEVTFMDVCVINNSSVTYSDFHQGVWLDHGLTSDHSIFGSDSAAQLAYAYYPQNTSGTYVANPPAVGIVNLNGNTTGMQCTPQDLSATARWNFMNGLKSSGQPWQDLSGNPTTFAFNGDPNDANSWNQLSHPDAQEYSSFLMSTNTGTFAPNETILGNYALIYARSGTNLQNVTHLIELSDSVTQFYGTAIFQPCENGYLGLEEEKRFLPEIYPNPTTGQIHVANWDGSDASYQLADLQGKIVRSGKLQSTIELNELVNGVYVLVLQTSQGTIQKRIVKE